MDTRAYVNRTQAIKFGYKDLDKTNCERGQNTLKFYLGSYSGGCLFNGIIEDFRMYDYVLNEYEIKNSRNRSLTHKRSRRTLKCRRANSNKYKKSWPF